jgi:hypothetical protein
VSRRLVLIFLGIVVVMGAGAYALLNLSNEPAAPPGKVIVAPPPVVAPPPAPELVAAEPAPAKTPARLAPTPKAEAPPPAPAPAPEAAPTTGTLHIDSDVPGAQVFIDRTFVGATPVTAKDITPGSHRLNVSAPGQDPYADTIDVAAGPRDIMIRLKDIKLDAKIDVVHKHAFGSCKGTLYATVQGLRYDTTNKSDAFTASFADIASFDVDYLEKNLKVKLKNGKQYNFTDAEGNADRLYLFHGEVNAAREKLKKGGGL